MKKAQILSAIALAFALGVVAPIAGVYAADINVGEIQDKASKESLSNAIGNVKNNANYQAYNTLYTAAGADTDANAWKDINETTLMNAINDALTNGSKNGIYDVKADLKPADYEAADTLAGAIENAEGVSKLIPEYQALIAAINNTENPATYATLVDLATKAGLAIDDTNEDKDTNNLKDAIKENKTYKAYEALNTALTNATKAVDEQAKRIKDLKKALAVANDVITPTMISEAATVTKGNTTPVANLAALAKTATTSTLGKKYVALIQEVADAEDTLKGAASTETDYATAIKNLNADFKAATGTDLSLSTPTDPVAPEKPGEGDDNQGGEGDGKGDGATTPDTGVIANSEATATSTASIMAGIATALTAAGVGVVAFRNIRRNKKA